MAKVTVGFADVSERLKRLALPEVDCVIGIATDGIVPASLVAHQLGKPMHLLHINFRTADNATRYESPRVLAALPALRAGQHILLVDDVAVSGATLERARQELASQQITTLVMKGSANFVLFPEITSCVQWPWQAA